MAILIEGIGRVAPDDDQTGKSDRDLAKIVSTLNGVAKTGNLTEGQRAVLNNAKQTRDLRKAAKNNNATLKGVGLVGISRTRLARARNGSLSDNAIAKIRDEGKQNTANLNSAKGRRTNAAKRRAREAGSS